MNEKLERRRNERLLDMDLRLKVIHKMRFIVLEAFSDIHETQEYIEANEILNEVEKRVWEYIESDKKDN